MIKRTKDDGENNDFNHLKVEKWELPIVEVLHKKNLDPAVESCDFKRVEK
jgi:hypothetical protein